MTRSGSAIPTLATTMTEKKNKNNMTVTDLRTPTNTLDAEYFKLLNAVLEKGNVKKDRTGVGTISVFSHEMRIDLTEGLSLLTTKYVHYPAVIHELLWFLKGGTDIKYLVDNGVKIWNDWPYKRYLETPIYDLSYSDKAPLDETAYTHFTMEEYVDAIKNVPGFAERHGSVGKVYGAQWVNWSIPVEENKCGTDAIEELRRETMGNSEYKYKIEGYNQIAALIEMLKTDPDSRRMLVTAWDPSVLPMIDYRTDDELYADYLKKN